MSPIGQFANITIFFSSIYYLRCK